MVTNNSTISDIMFSDASLHDENGMWQAIFGLNVLPEYRRQGLAAKLIDKIVEQARQEGRKGCILTCKDKLIHYYEKFGFKKIGKLPKFFKLGNDYMDFIMMQLALNR